jgi:hypothetical protein
VTAQEIELWVRDVVSAVRQGQPVEESRIGLKSSWIEPRKAADRLAAHANAARGVPILWVIGVDEKNRRVTGVDPLERSDWYKSVEQCFDGFAPRLVDVNVRIESDTVVGLYFETEQGARYVVKNSTGGYPQFIVPWREGTDLKAARREDLLRILVPIRRLSALIDELEFNLAIARNTKTIDSLGARFKEDECHKALGDGVLSTLPSELKRLVTEAYVATSRANQIVAGALSSSPSWGHAKSRHQSLARQLPQVAFSK